MHIMEIKLLFFSEESRENQFEYSGYSDLVLRNTCSVRIHENYVPVFAEKKHITPLI